MHPGVPTTFNAPCVLFYLALVRCSLYSARWVMRRQRRVLRPEHLPQGRLQCVPSFLLHAVPLCVTLVLVACAARTRLPGQAGWWGEESIGCQSSCWAIVRVLVGQLSEFLLGNWWTLMVVLGERMPGHPTGHTPS
jgi:hypothetical protein